MKLNDAQAQGLHSFCFFCSCLLVQFCYILFSDFLKCLLFEFLQFHCLIIKVQLQCSFNAMFLEHQSSTPQPLYNFIVGVQDNFRVSYPIRVITRVKYIDI